MQINLFKTTKPKNYKLDEREKVIQLEYYKELFNLYELTFIIIMIGYIILNAIHIFTTFSIPNIPIELLFIPFYIVLIISPIISIKRHAIITNKTYFLGILSTPLIFESIINQFIKNDTIGIIIMITSIIISYLIYLIIANKNTIE
jgi:hypothetical protein